MQIKNYCLKIIVLVFYVIQPSYLVAAPEAKYLMDLSSLLTQEYNHLSPSNGCLWWTTPVVESMYRFDPLQLDQKTAAVNKFMRLLFYLNNDQVNFNTMQNPTEIATYLTPNHIGQIVAVIENFAEEQSQTVEKKDEKDVKSKGQGTDLVVAITGILKEPEAKVKEYINKSVGPKGFGAKIGELNRVLMQLDKDKNRLIGKKEKDSKRLHKLIDHIKKHVANMQRVSPVNVPEQQVEKKESKGETKPKKTSEALLKELQKDQEVLQEIINKEEENLLKVDSEVKVFKAELSKFSAYEKLLQKSFAQAFAISCKDALMLCNDDDYRADTVRNLLLAFMWAISENKQDLLGYFKGLASRLNDEQTKKIFSDIGLGVLHDKQKQEAWTGDFYTHKFFGAIARRMEEDPAIILSNMEIGVLCYRAYTSFFSAFPQNLPYLNGMKYKDFSIEDCGETSAHNFFNAVLYDAEKGEFVIERLTERKNAVIHKDLIAFYKKYSKPDGHDSTPVHVAFADIVSNIPGVSYNKRNEKNGECELSSARDAEMGLENMNKVIMYLTGFETIEALCNELGIKCEVSYQGDGIYRKICLKLFVRGGICEWYFMRSHFRVDFLSMIPQQIAMVDKLENAVFLQDEKTQKKYIEYSKLRILNAFIPLNDLDNVLNKLFNCGSSNAVIAQTVFFQKLHGKAVGVCKKLSQVYNWRKMETWLAHFVGLLYRSVPKNDPLQQGEFFSSLTNYPEELLVKIFAQINEQLTDSSQKFQALDFLVTRAPKQMLLEKNSWIRMIFEQIKKDRLPADMLPLLNAIIRSRNADFLKDIVVYLLPFSRGVAAGYNLKDLCAQSTLEEFRAPIVAMLKKQETAREMISVLTPLINWNGNGVLRNFAIFIGLSECKINNAEDVNAVLSLIKHLFETGKYKIFVTIAAIMQNMYERIDLSLAKLDEDNREHKRPLIGPSYKAKFLSIILPYEEMTGIANFIINELPKVFSTLEADSDKAELLEAVIKSVFFNQFEDLVVKGVSSLRDETLKIKLEELLNEVQGSAKKEEKSNDQKQ